jgi:hypothetical protein
MPHQMLGDEVLASFSDSSRRKPRAVDATADARIHNALHLIKQAKGPICLDCLGVSPNDEAGLVVAFATYALPTHRIAEGACTKCGKQLRVVRKVRSLP